MEELMSNVHSDNEFLKGVIRQDKQTQSLQREVTELKAKRLAQFITISGIEGDEKDENCMITAQNFLKDKMKMDISEGDVLTTHRQGMGAPGRKPRSLVVKGLSASFFPRSGH